MTRKISFIVSHTICFTHSLSTLISILHIMSSNCLTLYMQPELSGWNQPALICLMPQIMCPFNFKVHHVPESTACFLFFVFVLNLPFLCLAILEVNKYTE